MINGGKKLVGRIGDPMDQNTLYGPMHNQNGVDLYKRTVQRKGSNSLSKLKSLDCVNAISKKTLFDFAFYAVILSNFVSRER